MKKYGKSLFIVLLVTAFVIGCKKNKINRAPVANAGLAQVVQLPVDFVTLSGSGKDEDGSIASYLWTQLSGPNNSTIQAVGSPATKVTGLIAGTYHFQLKVVDNSGVSGIDSVAVTVLAPFNKVPVSNAGSSAVITLPTDFVSVSGSGTDADGNIVAYLWSQISGPSSTVIDNPGATSTQIKGFKEGKYVFQLMVTDNQGATGVDTASVTVNPNPIKTLTLQPGPTEGQDARPADIQGCSPGNPYGNAANDVYDVADLAASAWTYGGNGCSTGQLRSFLKFTGLNIIPQSATILSAKLSLYGVTSSTSSPQGNSYYPGSPYTLSNELWLKRVTGDWSESTITWNNKPAVTDVNRIAIPASTLQWGYNVTDIDVTEMIKAMVNNANSNHGFCLMNQVEEIYRCMIFASSDHTDATKRPKLVVVYQ